MPFALKETLASKKHNQNIWFRFWTVIGPCCTSNPELRALFRSKEEAMKTPAYTSPLSFFEPVEVDEQGDFDWNN